MICRDIVANDLGDSVRFVDFGIGMSVSIFPFGVKGVDMVKCPDEIRTRCAAPDCDGVILVGEFVELFVKVGVKMRIGNKNADGR